MKKLWELLIVGAFCLLVTCFAFSGIASALDTDDDFDPWSVSPEAPPIKENDKSDTPAIDTDRLNASPFVSIVWFINAYSALSSDEPSCTFQPTCSEYTRQAIAKHGLFLGLIMGVERVLRYHHDHVGHELIETKDGYKISDPLKYNDFWFRSKK